MSQKTRNILKLSALTVSLALLTGCSTVGVKSAEELTYNLPPIAVATTNSLMKLVVDQRLSPLSAARSYGYTLAAAHEAFTQSEDLTLRDADAATAAALTGIEMFAGNAGAKAEFEAMLFRYSKKGETNLGKMVAERWITRARADNSKETAGDSTYKARDDEWGWVPTGLLRMPFIDPAWSKNTPIVASTSTCDIPEPPLENMKSQLPSMFENFDVGSTAEPIVFTFLAGTGTPTPPGQWMSMGVNLVRDQKLDDVQAMDLLAKLGVVAYDVSILIWREKLEHSIARPETMWDRFTGEKIILARETPNHPAYPSGHSGFSGAGAEVVKENYANSGLRLELPEDLAAPAETWTFENADQARNLISQSRVIARFHFMADVTAGESLGKCAGEKVIEAFSKGELK